MGWDIRLHDEDGKTLKVPRHTEGSTYAVGGTTEANIAVTYNYAECFRLVPGYHTLQKTLHGKQASWILPWLEQVVEFLGTKRWEDDYWAPTPGNAGYVVSILRDWARLYPDGIWEVD